MTWLNAPNILKPETIKAAESLGPVAAQILDRWASGWKKETLSLEKSGDLIERLSARAKIEREIEESMRPGGPNNHLTRHEVMEMLDHSPAP